MNFNLQNALIVIPSVITFFALTSTKNKKAIAFSLVVEILYALLLAAGLSVIVELAVQLQIICFLLIFVTHWVKIKKLEVVPSICIALLMGLISIMNYIMKRTADIDDIELKTNLYYFIFAVPSMNLGLLSIVKRTNNDNNK